MATFNKGDKVQVTSQYDYYHTHLAQFVWDGSTVFEVLKVSGITVTIGLNGKPTAMMNIKDLVPAQVQSGSVSTSNVPEQSQELQVDNTLVDNQAAQERAARAVTAANNTDYSMLTQTWNGNKANYLGDIYDVKKDPTAPETINKATVSPVNIPDGASLTDLAKIQHPGLVQNGANFPKISSTEGNVYHYNYYMNYDVDQISPGVAVNDDIVNLERALNIDIRDRHALFIKNNENYNRFKMPNPNDRLARTFSHVFFVRPDCNIFADGVYGDDPVLRLAGTLDTLAEFYRAKESAPYLLRQLTQEQAAFNHEFMMFPSNKARSFELKDQYITTKESGAGLTGYKVPIGKHDVESKTSDSFSISYIDDRDLHIYNLHYLWTSYIAYVYRGKHSPKLKYMLHKNLDYATCVYYILCAEDGETIIFWSKYWGVFPTDAPSSPFSWNANSSESVRDPEYTIKYQYAWKEDYNPLSLVEFNRHSNRNYVYTPNMRANGISPGYTWVGAPFIETVASNDPGQRYTFKLRFRQ